MKWSHVFTCFKIGYGHLLCWPVLVREQNILFVQFNKHWKDRREDKKKMFLNLNWRWLAADCPAPPTRCCSWRLQSLSWPPCCSSAPCPRPSHSWPPSAWPTAWRTEPRWPSTSPCWQRWWASTGWGVHWASSCSSAAAEACWGRPSQVREEIENVLFYNNMCLQSVCELQRNEKSSPFAQQGFIGDVISKPFVMSWRAVRWVCDIPFRLVNNNSLKCICTLFFMTQIRVFEELWLPHWGLGNFFHTYIYI